MCFDTLSSSVWGGKNLKSGFFLFCISKGFVCFFYYFFFNWGITSEGLCSFFLFFKKKSLVFMKSLKKKSFKQRLCLAYSTLNTTKRKIENKRKT